MRKKMLSVLSAGLAGCLASQVRAAFDNGALYVVRVGDGSSTVFNSSGPYYAAAVAIDEYSAATGSLLSVDALPSIGAGALTLSTNNGDDSGRLNFTGDGNYLTLGGYRQDASNTAADPALTTTVARVIGRVSGNGVADTSTALSNIYVGTAITSVVSANGTSFYAAGGASTAAGATTSGGLQYISAIGAAATAANVGANPTTDSFRNARLISGTLYVETPSSSVNRGVYRVKLGTTTTYSPIIVSLKGQAIDSNGNNDSGTDGTGKLYPKTDIHFFDTNGDGIYDTAYSTGGKSDIEKWTYTGTATSNATLGSTWSRTSYISLNSGVDINSLDAVQDGSNVDLFLSSDLGIYKMVDTGGGGSLLTSNVSYGSSFTNGTSGVVETTGTYTGNYFISVADASDAAGFSQFRGLAVTAVPEPVGILALAGGAVLLRPRSRRRA